MWNEFLNQSRSERKFENKSVLVLGNRHSGKRSLVDSLFDISKTTVYAKKMATHVDANKMKLKGLTPIIDYAYLNVLDFTDPDYRTHSKLQMYMIEDRTNPEVFAQLQNPEILKSAVILLMLDFTNPWNFLEQLDGWIKFIYELQKNAGFSIVDLQAMSDNVTQIYRQFRDPEFDENGKVKNYFHLQQEELQQQEIPDEVLTSNIRMPFIICVNKCDLQTSVLREQSSNKILFILYHLRKYCVKYGGSLIYTSIKNNSNLSVLYEYILHRAYSMPLRHKPETINEEAIFIPLGSDSNNLIEDSVVKMDMSRSYLEVICPPSSKKTNKEEVVVEQDSQYFKKYINQFSSSQSNTTVNSSSSSIRNQSDDASSNSTQRAEEVAVFFRKLLKNQTPDEQRRNAEKVLERHVQKQE